MQIMLNTCTLIIITTLIMVSQMVKDVLNQVFPIIYTFVYLTFYFTLEWTDEDESVTKMLYEALVFKYESQIQKQLQWLLILYIAFIYAIWPVEDNNVR